MGDINIGGFWYLQSFLLDQYFRNKCQPRPFFEHTGTENIDLTSLNNTQRLCFPAVFPRPILKKIKPRPILEFAGNGNINLASPNNIQQFFFLDQYYRK